MRIQGVEISNFRGIEHAVLSELQDMVVVAGPNGSGKSCILDAIRLLKSVYGGYQPNEWQQWMGEFQINVANDPNGLASLFYDRTKQITITCDIALHPSERQYISDHAIDFVRQSIWRVIAPELHGWSSINAAPMAAQLRSREQEVEARTRQEVQLLLAELAQPQVRARLTLQPGGQAQVEQSKTLELLFSIFRPQHLGLIDYHGPQRLYSREQIQGINLNLEALEQQRSQQTLYNYSGKYANVKSEMAASYIREALAQRAGVSLDEQHTLTNTLKELFVMFFPEKEFLGPQPTPEGGLQFPVRLSSGAVHDLNELSSGEKEVLYGYLRLRNSAPRYSVVLLDEPELHLNPRLVRGLPEFYHRHIGRALSNQVWLITHSDALLRETVGRTGYSVFHMLATTSRPPGTNQSQKLAANEDLERAVIALVGDLATYRPGAKIVLFEGQEDSEFDRRMTGMLFPAFQELVNAVSGGNRTRVRDFHEVLRKLAARGSLPLKVYSIVDRDSEAPTPAGAEAFTWDVYHIENYLLEPRFILAALNDINASSSLDTEDKVYEELRECARETLGALVRHKLASAANQLLMRAINTRTDPNVTQVALPLHDAIVRSVERVRDLAATSLTLQQLQQQEGSIHSERLSDLSSDDWRRNFRGRDVLKRFVGRNSIPVKYEVFRDLVLARMRDASYTPAGMKEVIDKILSS